MRPTANRQAALERAARHYEVERMGRVYGRGIADNEGQHLINLGGTSGPATA